MKYKFLIGLLLGLFVGFIIGNRTTKTYNLSQNVSRIDIEEKTDVAEYQQGYVPEKSEQGYCWVTSIAAPSNNKAWRCMTGNFIHDPCFETKDGKIVCDVDPEDANSGFELKLTEELPQRERLVVLDYPWWIKLENNILCYPMTGSAGYVDEISYHYQCNKENTVILEEIDTNNPIWTVRLGYIEERTIAKEEKLEVLQAWK